MTWIFMPSNCLPASACSERDCEPGSDTWASRIAPSATLSGRLTQPPSWRRASKKAAWMRLLSGATFAPSTLDDGLEPWIASLRDSRAKTCQLLASAQALTGPDQGFSLKSCALPTIAVRSGSFWRTSQASLLPPPPLWTKPKGLSKSAQPPESWESWPTSGGIRSGLLFPRPTWVPVMGGRGGFVSHGAWVTPDCNTSTYSNGKMGPNIREQAAAWPTPNAHVIEHKSKPPIVDGTRQPSDPQISTADFAVHVFSHQTHPTPPGQESSSTGPTSPRRLNPAFVEWLMGWPTGWTIAESSASSAAETALWRRKLLRHLSSFIGD